MTYRRHLMWFTNDLRLDDNPPLRLALREAKALLCLYCVDPRVLRSGQYVDSRIGNPRRQFLRQSLGELDRNLRQHGQHLVIVTGDPVQIVSDLVTQFQLDGVFQSTPVAWDERQQWLALGGRFPFLNLQSVPSHQLFTQQQLPFALEQLPSSFSKFRRRMETEPVRLPLPAPDQMPPPLTTQRGDSLDSALPALNQSFSVPSQFTGGEAAAHQHLENYFSADHASRYKETRNALFGFAESTKFSPWLAHGCLSPHQIYHRLSQYQASHGANDSTDWIYVELLWREYFHWYARSHGRRLFRFRGIGKQRPLTSFYPHRFKQWCSGTTPWPLVNACMHQLNETGYLSNRGRQIAASALIHDLEVDWRAGAYQFEKSLIDYDPASNWGNWQYLAGVGADPRGGRHFNLDKQTQLYDPKGTYREHWNGGTAGGSIDTVDAADWPLPPT